MNEFIDLVETMRKAQDHYYAIAKDRSGKFQPFQRTRALQAARTAESRVDKFIAQYRADQKRITDALANAKPSALPGLGG